MQPMIEEQRARLRSLSVHPSTPSGDLPLVVPSQKQHEASVQSALSLVAADLLSTYSEIDTLPKKLACLYLITHVLNVS
jgi:hypothetical protein